MLVLVNFAYKFVLYMHAYIIHSFQYTHTCIAVFIIPDLDFDVSLYNIFHANMHIFVST